MSQRAAELAQRIDSIGELDSIVGALRGIAAARAQQGRSRVEGVRAYAETLGRAIATALALCGDAPPSPAVRSGGTLQLLFCAESGFAGAFSERILEAASAERDVVQRLVVGRRGQRAAIQRDVAVDGAFGGLLHADSAAALADRLAADLLDRLESDAVSRATLVHALPDGVVTSVAVLPLDLRRFAPLPDRPLPLVQLPPALLLQDLAMEYLRAQITQAALYTFAAESTARMQAMSAARDNIARTLERLRGEARIARQDQITAEVMELASGAQAQAGAVVAELLAIAP